MKVALRDLSTTVQARRAEGHKGFEPVRWCVARRSLPSTWLSENRFTSIYGFRVYRNIVEARTESISYLTFQSNWQLLLCRRHWRGYLTLVFVHLLTSKIIQHRLELWPIKCTNWCSFIASKHSLWWKMLVYDAARLFKFSTNITVW